MAIPIGSCPICIATRINCGETPNISAASAGFMLFSLNLSRLSMYFPPSAFLPGFGLATVVGCITGLGFFPTRWRARMILFHFCTSPFRLYLLCSRFFPLKKLQKNLLYVCTLFSWCTRCYFYHSMQLKLSACYHCCKVAVLATNVPCGTRTHARPVMSRVLLPTELTALIGRLLPPWCFTLLLLLVLFLCSSLLLFHPMLFGCNNQRNLKYFHCNDSGTFSCTFWRLL